MSQAGIINVASGGGGGILTIKGDDGVIVSPDGVGNINLDGLVVANGTHPKAVFTESPAANTEKIDIQVSAAIAATNITKVGLSAFDNSQFTVDANGFVQLIIQPNFQPNKVIQDFDDFLSVDQSGSQICKLGWLSNITFNEFPGTNTHPGIITPVSLNLGNNVITLFNDSSGVGTDLSCFLLGGGSLNINWVMNLVTLSTVANRYDVYIGITDTSNVTPLAPTNGCYFKYNDSVNGGNWQLICNNAGVTTTVNTAVAATTGFHNFGIQVNAGATSVSFTLDGVAIGSAIVSNIPSVHPISPSISFIPVANYPAFLIDLFYYTQTLITAR